MRLELQNVEFKNFLSYGNTLQRLDFLEGVNLILGINKTTGRSNGSGKCVEGSTIIEIDIPDNIKKDFLSFLNHYHLNLNCAISKIYQFYNEYPQHKGKISVNTPLGFKTILDAYIIEKNAICYEIQTTSFILICSPYHRVFTTDWQYVKDLNIGDSVKTENGYECIISTKVLTEKHDLYDITVEDVEQYYSNGILSHNSSLIETIPFAWFGKLSRPVTKDKIPNWVNRKNCEVSNEFKKGNNTYKVIRGIKPDKFEIYENGNLIPIPSNIKSYQEMFENEIIHMDYNTFMYLFYTNLNMNVPLLKMTTPQKRAFLERMFLLDTYTDLNTTCNERIKALDEKIFQHKVKIENHTNTIKDLTRTNITLGQKIVDIKPFEDDLKKAKDDYEDFKKNTPYVDDPNIKDDIIQNIETLNEEVKSVQDNVNTISTNISVLKADIISNEKSIEDIKKQKAAHEESLVSVKEKLSELEDKDLIKNISTCENAINILNDDIETDKNERLKISEDISTYKERKRNLEEKQNLLKDGICPTCGSNTSGKIATTLNKDLDDITNILNKESDRLYSLELSIKDKMDSLLKHKENLVTYNDKRSKLDKLNTEYKTLLEVKLPSFVPHVNAIKDDKEKIANYTEQYNELTAFLDKKKDELETQKRFVESVMESKKENKEKLDHIKSLEEQLELRKSNRDEIRNLIKENGAKIESSQVESKTLTSAINKLNELIDYLNYLKVLCKDENVKQYAIGSYMSYLVQQVNFYLSSAGSTHYMKFTKWLDEEIHGPGVFGATYGNLSGGESRSIDLAIQFAFLDVARLKTGIFPDVLLLDEILDSSIDSGGLSNILKIIKSKQTEDKSKIFIITHRAEISDMEADNVYNVTKKDGFSTLKKE